MRVVTRAFSMASTVSGSPGPVPGAGGNWALAAEAKAKNTSRQKAQWRTARIGCGAQAGCVSSLGGAGRQIFIERPLREARRTAIHCEGATAREKQRVPKESR